MEKKPEIWSYYNEKELKEKSQNPGRQLYVVKNYSKRQYFGGATIMIPNYAHLVWSKEKIEETGGNCSGKKNIYLKNKGGKF